ncbi:MAG: hypothetical protein ACE145_06010 [Terriglobia bacterium]
MVQRKREKKGLIYLGMPRGFEGTDCVVLKDSGNRAGTSHPFIIRDAHRYSREVIERFVRKIYMKGGGKLTKVKGIPGLDSYKFPVLWPECWFWRDKPDPDGYGRFSLNGKMVQAHILAFEMFREPLRDKTKELNHLCDTRNCVNPWHLEPMEKREHRKQQKRQRNGIPVEGVQETKRPVRRIRGKSRKVTVNPLDSFQDIVDEVTGSVGPVEI